MNKTMDRSEYEDKLLQLIYLSEANLRYCKQIEVFIRQKRTKYKLEEYTEFLNDDRIGYFVLVSNNHFLKSVSIVHNLLHMPSRYKGALSFQDYLHQNYLEEEPKKCLEKELESLWNIYEDYDLDYIRDKFAAHLDRKCAGDVFYFAYKLISDEHTNHLEEIIDKLKYIVCEYFDDPIINNYIYRKIALSEIITKTLEID